MMRYHKNELLVSIARQLEKKQPNWDEVVKRLKKSSLFQSGDDTKLAGFLSEMTTRVSLEEICMGLEGRIRFDPIPEWAHTKRHVFIYHGHRLIVIRKNGKNHTDYDLLLSVDEMPVLFEVKISENSRKSGVSREMDEQRISYKVGPLMEYFGVDSCGYVLVIDPRQVQPYKLPLQQNFLNRGGLLVPFYTDRKTFREDVARIRQQHDI